MSLFYRQPLGRKLFFSYMVIILVSLATLAIAVEVHTPTAVARHMNNMTGKVGEMLHNQHDVMSDDLLSNITRAINEVLLVASGIAIAAAIAVSSFVTRRIITPIQSMQFASQRIADGDYAERIPVVSEDELGAMAVSFNAMARTLEATETRRRQLIGDVAHELRTPLSNVRSVLEGVVDGVLENSPATLIGIQDDVRRLQRIVADLEALSKAEAGQLPLEKTRINPAGFIGIAADRLAWQYEDKGVDLTIALPITLPQLYVDAERMTQVMLNLLGNALQYSFEGGVVCVSAETTPNTLAIHITDTGVGLTETQTKHIFERFYRVDKSRTRASGGSGIGLTISKHIAEAHNGSLIASSAGLNKGSTFTLTLPIA